MAKATTKKNTSKKKRTQTTNDAATTNEAVEKDLPVEQRVERIIRRNMLWSAGAGVIPLPYIDMAAVMAVQIKLLKELSEIYDVPLKVNAGKSAVAVLIGGIAATGGSYGLMTSGLWNGLMRSVPVVGQLLALATMPAFAAATTYAIGKVFDRHFASGGTFLTFDPKKVEGYFREKFCEAKKDAAAAAA
jgi:uncharacterized protein (DUF697 family)